MLYFSNFATVNRDLAELDFSFSVLPSQGMKTATFSAAINEYRKSLPIFNYKQIILNYLSDNKVLIIHGGVASGKSTQVMVPIIEHQSVVIFATFCSL